MRETRHFSLMIWCRKPRLKDELVLFRFLDIPCDTKLLLTKNYSEIIIFGKITNLTRNSLKMSFFPGHFERTKFLKNSEK